MSEQRYGGMADQAARRYGIDPALYRRLIAAESGWNPSAVSPVGARGLTQVMPKYHPGANLSTPQGQLDYGAKHLATLLKNFKSPRLALAAYNAGAGAVKKYGDVPPYAETQNYVSRILSGYKAGGQTSGAGAGAVPPAVSPAPEALQGTSGSLDAKRLMMLLNNQRQRSLRGLMPAPGFQRELQKVLTQALPRAGVNAAAQQVGSQAAHAGEHVHANFKGFRMGGGPEAHHSRALGDWQSDDAYDLMGKAGDPVPAFVSGTVTKISGKPGGDPGFAGYGITVRTPQGDLFFKHLGTSNVKVGQKITPQTILGTLDAKTAGGPHLHLGGTSRALIDRLAKLYTSKR